MTQRTATRVSRGLIVLAVVMGIVTVLASTHTTTSSLRAPIVVGDLPIPATCDPAIVPTDAVAQDTKTAWCQAQEEITSGSAKEFTPLNAVGLIGFVLALSWIVTGSLIVSRQPRNLAGWLFAGIGLAWLSESLGVSLTAWALTTGSTLPLAGAFAILGDSPLVLALLVPLLFLLFPDGHAPARWRWLTWVFAGSIVALIIGYTFAPGPLNNFVDVGIIYANPIGIGVLGPFYGPLSGLGGIGMLLASLATVLAVRSRYRAATGETRQQLRWLVAVATLAGVLLLGGIVVTIAGSGAVNLPVFPVLLAAIVLSITIGVPGAYLIAIFRYRLWDLDIVIKKTGLYVVVAIVFFGVFALATLVVSGLVGLTGALDSDVGSTLAAVTIGILVWPAVLVARRVADRIVYGGRARPYEVLTGFTGRIGDTYATDDVLLRMAQVLAEGMGASSASVQLRVGADLRELASFGTRTGADTVEPVMLHGEEVGALTVTMPPNDPINPAKDRLIADLATQAGPVLRNVQLIEELRASRQRLVAAQDEERRKLERNIHDGVQQQLVALAVRLKLVDTMVDRDPAKAHEALASLQADAGTALEELRDLARGIYPPLLADRGLPTALEAQARKAAVPTTVNADGVGRYDQAVEAAVYFCTLEALNNVAKYASASQAEVLLAQDNGVLRFEVRDDGTGFDVAAARSGTGLQGMTDRLDAIGGELRIASEPGAGTVVGGMVPVTTT